MLDQLQIYAQKSDPRRTIPSDVLVTNDEHTVTIFDLFPKAKYHLLVLPRLPLTLPSISNDLDGPDEITPLDLVSLDHLLQSPHESSVVLQVLEVLKVAADEATLMVQDEMHKTEGFVWDVHVGFHAVPSMIHLHVHVISGDLVSERLRHKKHYNSFRPDMGFFVHLDDVIARVKQGDRTLPRTKQEYHAMLGSDLCCFRCKETYKNMPLLKAHLKKHWERENENLNKKGESNLDRNQEVPIRKR